LPTIFTTNYRLQSPAASAASGPRSLDRGADPEPAHPADPASLRSLASRISPMLVSRLYEMTRPVVLDAVEDFRREQKSYRTRV